MKLHFFGTNAGTEPQVSGHHTSFALENQDGLYWFDAGENCSYTAHLMGVPLLNLRKVFISHTHMDHVGGLANLFWNVRKLCWVYQTDKTDPVDLYIPNLETWDGILSILKNTEGGFKTTFEIRPHPVTDGVLYDGEHLKVTAMHNLHLPKDGDVWRSFSYLIETDGKRIIFSGDIASMDDLAPFLRDGCDILLQETGHHTVEVPCDYLTNGNFPVKKLVFLHNGRDVTKDLDDALARAQKHFSGEVLISRDGTSLEI